MVFHPTFSVNNIQRGHSPPYQRQASKIPTQEKEKESMSNRHEIAALLAEIRQAREETLTELADVTEADFDVPTPLARWDSLRRILLRVGEHMREHASQMEGIRAGIGRAPTPPERMLAEAELVWGKLLAATVNLTDDDLDTTPADGGWTVREALQHMATVEKSYLEGARAGLADDAKRKTDPSTT